MIMQGTIEQRVAESLDNKALAHRVRMIRDNRRAFSKTEADAFLDEAAKRLQWNDVYEAHDD